MDSRKFFMTFCTAVAVVVGTLTGVNYSMDYYGVFRGKDEEVRYGDLNDRYVKMDYLLEDGHFQKYDTYVFGSSRVKKCNPAMLGGRAYNLGVTAGMPQDCLHDLSLLLEAGAEVKTVCLAVDIFSFTRDYDGEVIHVVGWIPYPAEPMGNLKYKLQILMAGGRIRDDLKNPKKFFTRRQTDGEEYTLLHENGVCVIPAFVDRKIEEDPENYVEENKFGEPARFPSQSKRAFPKVLQTITEIKRLCDEHGIRFLVYFNPIHMTTYLATPGEDIARYKKALADITPFYDFSGVNAITANNYFWYETSHPRAFVCDKLLDEVSGRGRIKSLPDFGHWVTPENVDAYNAKDLAARAAYDPAHEQWIPDEETRARMNRRE